ncbi:MAG: DeoR/GlpR transcriptional regulator [Spirochaetales bacterium]|nr:DeoR/GlpR transcriptional regulator [Spirochaetales bacterium]
MILEERYTTIENKLKKNNFVKVSEIMDSFEVSHETARKYLEVLQERGIAKRIRGGAMYAGARPEGNSHLQRRTFEFHRENAVASYAASKLVKPGDVVFLDGGMTMAQLALYLRDIPSITVVTNNLIVINELNQCPNIDIYSLSGRYDIESGAYYGSQTEKSLAFFNVDIAFISCAGLSLKQEYVNDYDDRCVNRYIVKQHSEKIVLVLNSSKINKKHFSNQFPIKDLDEIFIDSNIDADEEQILRAMGVELHVIPIDTDIPKVEEMQ